MIDAEDFPVYLISSTGNIFFAELLKPNLVRLSNLRTENKGSLSLETTLKKIENNQLKISPISKR